jgi:RNA polymerase-interacting CarD/CdnL/TRCF family regulator
MIRCIIAQKKKLESAKRKLPITDETDLKLAEKYIEQEFSFSLHISEENVVSYIEKMLGAAEA